MSQGFTSAPRSHLSRALLILAISWPISVREMPCWLEKQVASRSKNPSEDHDSPLRPKEWNKHYRTRPRSKKLSLEIELVPTTEVLMLGSKWRIVNCVLQTGRRRLVGWLSGLG